MNSHPRVRAISLLSHAIEARLGNVRTENVPVRVSPWDVWWASARADLPGTELGLAHVITAPGCAACVADARRMTAGLPVHRIDPDSPRQCGCMAAWARSMRSAVTAPTWPSWRITVAVIKPATDMARAERLLEAHFTVLAANERLLEVQDVRRLYPDAYGGPFRARQAAFLTSQPVRVLLLLAPDGTTSGQHHAIKRGVRRQLGVGDDLRNHLHLADNPGEAWCDVMHLAGPAVAQQLYERFERDRTADNLAFYRDLLARWIPSADPHWV